MYRRSVVESMLFSDAAFHQWSFRCADGPHVTHLAFGKTESSFVHLPIEVDTYFEVVFTGACPVIDCSFSKENSLLKQSG